MRRTWLLATTWLTAGLSKRNRGVGSWGQRVRSDTVQFGTGLPRAYNSIRMKSIGVTIAPIDDEGCTTLVGQYRYVLDRFTWELPAGGCRLDQAPVEAAKTN
jgi:hypothetical protein